MRVALNDRSEFVRRYAAVRPPCYNAHQAHPSKAQAMRDAMDAAKAKEAGDVADAVVRQFLEEEWCHQMIDLMFSWWDTRPGLSPVRPCRPADVDPADVDDDTLSSIGRDLLVLAERRARKDGRTAAIHPRGTE
jgi:hypothetical protein